MKGKCSKREGIGRFSLPCAGITLIRFTGVISAIPVKKGTAPRGLIQRKCKEEFFIVTFLIIERSLNRVVNTN